MENDRLFDLRDYNNLTQKAVGELLGVRQQSYGEWEKGNKIIPLRHLITLAKYYNLSLDYMTGLSKTKGVFENLDELDKEDIGKRIVYIRKIYNINQKELAKNLNTSPSTICAYEKGYNTILTAFAYQIAKDYNVSFDWLVGASKNMKRN